MNESSNQTATLSRLAGAMLLAGGQEFYLIGNTKEPCDWAAIGLSKPAEGEAAMSRVRRLHRVSEMPVSYKPCGSVVSSQSVEAIAEALAARLLIVRNASFSERLWRIVTGASDENNVAADEAPDVSWLVQMPDHVWEIVRETALKCL